MWFLKQAPWLPEVEFASWRDEQGRIQSGDVWDASPPISHFQQCFGWIKFGVISNLFITTCLRRLKHALSKLCEQNAFIFDKTLKIRGHNYKQNLPENCSKSTKRAFTACKLSKIFRGASPRTPKSRFCYSSCLKFHLCCRKPRLKKWRNLMPPPWKNFWIRPRHETF